MKICKVWLESIPGSPYSPSAMHGVEMIDRESWDDYDIRTWREHCTTNAEGQVCIPAMGLKQSIDVAAFKLGEKVPGRRGATFKNFFASGFYCNEDVPLSNGKLLTKADAKMVMINAHANGKRGSGTRVKRRFPTFDAWNGIGGFTITDDIITEEVFERHVRSSGIVVGIGRFRPENSGTNGRYRAIKFEWSNFTI